MRVTWESPLSQVAGKSHDLASSLGLETVGDILRYYPRAWVDAGDLSDLGSLAEGDWISLVGEITRSSSHTYRDRRTNRTAWRLETRVRTADAELLIVWFDRKSHTAQWREKALAPGSTGLFFGKLKWFRNEWQLTNPQYRMFTGDAEDLVARPKVVPVYRSSGKVTSWAVEELVALALDMVEEIPDLLPAPVAAKLDVISAEQAIRWVHRPDDRRQLGAALKRLRHEEAFLAQTVLAQRRARYAAASAVPRTPKPDGLLARFDADLPYQLTDGQRRVGEEIAAELTRPQPMHRLLQGDVGSGKTLVALRAMLQVADAGGQAVLLAPTEVLAQQHHRSLQSLLGPLGQGGMLGGDADGTRVGLVTGSLPAAARKAALAEVASGEVGIVVGTHALLQEGVEFADLGLVVVDEQHRFGVEQRAALSMRSATPPHVLVMTATPIPRSVAMTVFGDLDVSTLDEMPAGRAEVQTTVIQTASQPGWLDRAWQRIAEEVAAGHQAYVVCPRIGGDAKAEDEEPGATAVTELAPQLAAGPLAGLRVEVLHGQMAAEDKDRVMRGFNAGEVDVLVATTVVEVGVDVPNATVMVIMDADRFGVSQLHQLRGRIGRGDLPGLCLLVTDADEEAESVQRLQAVAATRDGFELAQVDLEQRREGDVLGTGQHGRSSALLAHLSVLDHADVIEAARVAATEYLASDPDLDNAPELRRVIEQVEAVEAAG